jgi:hypothetical protein
MAPGTYRVCLDEKCKDVEVKAASVTTVRIGKASKKPQIPLEPILIGAGGVLLAGGAGLTAWNVVRGQEVESLTAPCEVSLENCPYTEESMAATERARVLSNIGGYGLMAVGAAGVVGGVTILVDDQYVIFGIYGRW